jgi:hypothetical protein
VTGRKPEYSLTVDTEMNTASKIEEKVNKGTRMKKNI